MNFSTSPFSLFSSPLQVFLSAAFFFLLFLFVWLIKNRRFVQGRIQTPTLNLYARDLTLLASEEKLDPVIGREEEIDRVIQVLSRRHKNNPVLVGKSGVGKTAIAEGLAIAIVKGEVPKPLLHKRVLALDLPSIVAGTKYRGEFEQRLKRIADEIIASQRSIILFIDEIHTLSEAGEATGAIGADDILKPALARGDLQVIGATTREEYIKFIKRDPTLDRRLHPILVDEPTEEETLEILRGIRGRYEQYHNVKISDEAIREAVAIAAKKIPGKAFPDKAIDLIDEAASMLSLQRVEQEADGEEPVVRPEHIRKIFQEIQGERI